MSLSDLLPRRAGLSFVLSSPSGAGKTSLASALLAYDDNLKFSVSLTTRRPREGEVDGKDYYFVSRNEFERLRDRGDLLEWANVFGNFYGTPRDAVEETLSTGQDIIFDIDWQGMRQLQSHNLKNLVKVFILPPSKLVLEKRLYKRALDSEEVLKERMNRAALEMSYWHEYDYTIINDDFDRSLSTLNAIVVAERHRTGLQIGINNFVREFK
ncbi:MAG: guanylate kinase [Hyphomicrobiaceae bacterium]|nr:guanylate kinase [Hyphomicrobiaceae bacterium]